MCSLASPMWGAVSMQVLHMGDRFGLLVQACSTAASQGKHRSAAGRRKAEANQNYSLSQARLRRQGKEEQGTSRVRQVDSSSSQLKISPFSISHSTLTVSNWDEWV
jgi:hypothetical protein